MYTSCAYELYEKCWFSSSVWREGGDGCSLMEVGGGGVERDKTYVCACNLNKL